MMHASTRRLTSLVAVLLIASAALFAVGVAAERSSRSNESSAHRATESTSHVEGGGEEVHSAEAPAEPAATPEATSERLLGIDPESWLLVAIGVAASVLLAAALLVAKRQRLLLTLAVIFGVVFAALDGRELAHQISESRAGLAAIAALLIALHLAVAVAASLAARRPAGTVATTG